MPCTTVHRLKKGASKLFAGEDEIQTNLAAPVHLSAFFASLLRKRRKPPHQCFFRLVSYPSPRCRLLCYQGRRPQFYRVPSAPIKSHICQGIEIVPPAVDTELGGITPRRNIKVSRHRKSPRLHSKHSPKTSTISLSRSQELVQDRKELCQSLRELNSW